MSDLAVRRLAVSPHVHTREFNGELVILDLAGGRYFSLDEVGTYAWRVLADGKSLGEVAAAVAAEFDVAPDRALADLASLVQDLVAKGLVKDCARATGDGA